MPLLLEIQEDFKEDNLLLVDGNNISPDKQLKLNSLEAKDNIRIIVKLDLTHGQTMVPVLNVTEEYASETDVDYEIDPYL